MTEGYTTSILPLNTSTILLLLLLLLLPLLPVFVEPTFLS